MAKALSRPKRWAAAVNEAREALTKIQEGHSEFEAAMTDLNGLKEEYEEWKGNLPENLAQSALGEKLDAIEGLDFESATSSLNSAIDEAESAIGEAEGVDLPRGFGND